MLHTVHVSNLVSCVAKGEACYFRRGMKLPAQIIKRIIIDPATLPSELGVPDFQVKPFGIEIHNATITGELDLRSAKLEYGLRFYNCIFEDSIILAGARLRSLELKGCKLNQGMNIESCIVREGLEIISTTFRPIDKHRPVPYVDHSPYQHPSHIQAVLWGRNATINGSFLIINSEFYNEIFLVGIRINGSLNLSGTRVYLTRKDQRYAIVGYGAHITNTLYIREVDIFSLKDCGKISFRGSRIGTRVDGIPQGGKTYLRSLDLRESYIDGSVDLAGCVIREYLDLKGAEITGDLNLEDVAFMGKGAASSGDLKDWCLRGRNLKVGGSVVLGRDIQLGEPQQNTIGNYGLYNGKPAKRIPLYGAVDFVGASIGRNLVIDQVYLWGKVGKRNRALVAAGMNVQGSVLIRESVIKYAVDMRSVKIGGLLSFQDTEILYSYENLSKAERESIVRYPAINLRHAEVGLDLLLGNEDAKDGRFWARGRIRLVGMRIGNNFVIHKALLNGEIEAQLINVGQRVLFIESEFHEEVNFSGAVIKGSLEIATCSQTGQLLGGTSLLKGISLYGARIHQDLKLGGSAVKFGNETTTEGRVILVGAVIGGALVCTDATFYLPIDAHNIRVDQDVFLNSEQAQFTAFETVRLDGAVIKGNLVCRGGVFKKTTPRDGGSWVYKSPSDYCIYAATLTVEQNVYMGVHNPSGRTTMGKHFKAAGAVNFSNAKIGRQLDCRGGEFFHPGPRCFYAPRLEVKGDMNLCVSPQDPSQSFVSRGTVRIPGAHINGDLDLGGANLIHNENEYAIYAPGIEVGGGVFLNHATENREIGFCAKGCVRLDGGQIGLNLDCRGGRFLLSSRAMKQFEGTVQHESASETEGTPYIAPWVYSIYAPNLVVGGNVFCGVQSESSLKRRFTAAGPVSFAAAKIGGNFDCSGGDFRHAGSRCLYIPQIEVGRRLKLGYDPDLPNGQVGFQASGTVQLQGARVAGDIDCGGGQFKAGTPYHDVPEHCAIHAPGLRVGGNLYMNRYPKTKERFRSEGDVSITGSNIEGNLVAEGGTIEGAFNASDITASRSVYLGKVSEQTDEDGYFSTKKVDLSKAEIGHSLDVYGKVGTFDLSNATVKGSFVFAAKDQLDSGAHTGKNSQLLRLLRNCLVIIGSVKFKTILNSLKRTEIPTNTDSGVHACQVRINLQNASVDLWDDRYVFPKGEADDSIHEPYLWKMSREQILRAAVYNLSGFTYATLGEHLLECIQRYPREVGLWLNFVNVSNYDPQPYEHMAEVLKKHGEEAGYAAVVVAKRREHRQHVEPDKYLAWMIPLTSFILGGILWFLAKDTVRLFGQELGIEWHLLLALLGFVAGFIMLLDKFLHIKNFIFKTFGFLFDFILLHFPVHLIERPWRAPAYALIIWVAFSLFYLSIDARSHMAPAEGHLQYYLSKDKKQDAKNLSKLLDVLIEHNSKTRTAIMRIGKYDEDLASLASEVQRLNELKKGTLTDSKAAEVIQIARIQISIHEKVKGLTRSYPEQARLNELEKQIQILEKELMEAPELTFAQAVPQGYPPFRPFLYTLDRLVPFVEFAQSDAWIPDESKKLGGLLWYTDWLLRIIGFYLVTVLLGAVTGLVKAEKL